MSIPQHWRNAFIYRAAGAAVVMATGLFQTLPGKAHWLPVFAKVRLLIALVVSAFAASMLDRGYGFGVAGLVVIILTGTYIAVDNRDLLRINMLIVGALVPVILADLGADRSTRSAPSCSCCWRSRRARCSAG